MSEQIWRKADFHVEDGEVFEGYTSGETWNGWACPLFTKSTAQRIANEFNINIGIDSTMRYDEEVDAWIYRSGEVDENGEYTEEAFEGLDIFVNGTAIRVYPIGTWSWVWEEVIPEMKPITVFDMQKRAIELLNAIIFKGSDDEQMLHLAISLLEPVDGDDYYQNMLDAAKFINKHCQIAEDFIDYLREKEPEQKLSATTITTLHDSLHIQFEAAISDIFTDMMSTLNIPGDITPEQTIELDNLLDKITDLHTAIIKQNGGVDE